ncbi:hypothetical protein GCM10009539_54890 [Cryptosporangium japonicum]|uniref:Uncharacterized protein n=1 Tax=Cryptosporangium japonicum TaxID=80872 RepID=A0ABN0UUT0_9ACTN
MRDPYAFTIWDEVTIGLAPGWPGTEMPYSTSVPMIRRALMGEAYVPRAPAARFARRLMHHIG